MEVVAGHAGSDAAHQRAAEVLGAATTALMGRGNYEGFYGYWPPVAQDESADPRDRAIARWLDDVEKIVFSHTMKDAPWKNSRVADTGPVEEAARLRDTEGGDIVVVNSSSLIRQLIADHRANARLRKVLYEEAAQLQLRPVLEQMERDVVDAVRALLEDRRRETRVRDAGLAAFVVVTSVQALVHSALGEPERLVDDALGGEIVDLVCRYLVD